MEERVATLETLKSGVGKVTVEITAYEHMGRAAIRMTYRIDDGRPDVIDRLRDDTKAIILWRPIVVGGKKVGGLRLDNYDEIKAVRDRMLTEMQAQIHAENVARIEALTSGSKPLDISYHDGECLSGYEARGESADLLVPLGLAKYVDGWGYHVDSGLVERLGETITYPQAVEYARPALEAKAARAAAKAAERQAIFAKAAATGKPQLLRQWMEDCSDPNEDCNSDCCYEYAMPDGTTKIERHHAW